MVITISCLNKDPPMIAKAFYFFIDHPLFNDKSVFVVINTYLEYYLDFYNCEGYTWDVVAMIHMYVNLPSPSFITS